MFQNLLKELHLCLRASRESALRPEIFAANRFVHFKTPFLTITITIIFQDSRRVLVVVKRPIWFEDQMGLDEISEIVEVIER